MIVGFFHSHQNRKKKEILEETYSVKYDVPGTGKYQVPRTVYHIYNEIKR